MLDTQFSACSAPLQGAVAHSILRQRLQKARFEVGVIVAEGEAGGVRKVEGVTSAFSLGGNLGAVNVPAERGDRARQPVEQAGLVHNLDVEHRVVLGRLVVEPD